MPASVAELDVLRDLLPAIRDANLAHHRALIESAAALGARVLCLGELFAAPYFALGQDPMWLAMAEDATTGPTVLAMRAIAAASARVAEIDRRLAALEADIGALRQAVAADRDNLKAIDAATPEGGKVRERIITRTDEIDAMLDTARDLRAERLQAERDLRNP